MAENTAVKVDLGQRSYEILIGEALLDRLGEELDRVVGKTRVVIITDENVAAHYLQPVESTLKSAKFDYGSIVLPPGEELKCISRLDEIWQEMIEFGADRSSVIVALGGGVIGDLAGFAAATFMRGIRFVQVPTSLLAQVDSSVGGKTGINLPQGKNLVGAFLQPELVLVDTASLNTLDDRNFAAGMAEVIKYGVIMNEPFFDWLDQESDRVNSKDAASLSELIAECCRAKAQVVEEDERETKGRRAILNYGHTYGHAIENVYGYGTYLHGEAIAIGMQCAARMAVKLNMIDVSFLDRQKSVFNKYGLKTECPQDQVTNLVAAMKTDKKSDKGNVRLILPDRIGNVQLVDWPGDELVAQTIMGE